MANIPRVSITVYGAGGRIKSPLLSEQAVGAFEWISDYGGFQWMISWLGRWCLMQAEQSTHNPETADLWIERYKKIREIS